jgi:hypothetical protein
LRNALISMLTRFSSITLSAVAGGRYTTGPATDYERSSNSGLTHYRTSELHIAAGAVRFRGACLPIEAAC